MAAIKTIVALFVGILALAGAASAASVCPKYVVANGDSLFSISQKFKILPDDLNAALLTCGQNTALLQIGQEVCLPGGDKPGCANVQAYNKNNNCKVYVVQQGDTLSSVASSLDIYGQELTNLNNDATSSGVLKPGTYLRLPSWSSSCGNPNDSTEKCRVYVVQSGDFIAGIASAFRVDATALLGANPGLTADSPLQNGQPLKIPPFTPDCGAGKVTKPPTDTVLRCRGYRVQQGDDISLIAKNFKTTVNDISSVNPELAGSTVLQPGTVVKISPYDDSCEQPILVTSNDSPAPPAPAAGPIITAVPPAPIAPGLAPKPAAPIVAPKPAPVPVVAPSPTPKAPVPAPAAPAPSPSPKPEPVVPVDTPAPAPSSSASSVKVSMAVFGLIAAALQF